MEISYLKKLSKSLNTPPYVFPAIAYKGEENDKKFRDMCRSIGSWTFVEDVRGTFYRRLDEYCYGGNFGAKMPYKHTLMIEITIKLMPAHSNTRRAWMKRLYRFEDEMRERNERIHFDFTHIYGDNKIVPRRV